MASKTENRTFTREEFYAYVWSAPATTLAKELGCSDVMIGKWCKAFDVPKPYLGYWAKLANGKRPKKTPLPRNDNPELQSLTFHQHEDYEPTVNEPPREVLYDADIQEMLKRAKDLGPLSVPQTLSKPHALVAATREYDQQKKRVSKLSYLERDYSFRDHPKKVLSIEVSDELKKRAYRIMNAFIKRIEAIGGEVRVMESKYHYEASVTQVVLGGEVVSVIRLREKHNQKRHNNPNAKYSWDRNRTELVPSGLLLMDDGPGSYRSPLAMDGKAKKVEDKLEALILDFIKRVGEARIRRREEAELARIKAEEERLRQEREAEMKRRQDDLDKRKSEEAARIQQLIDHASNWQQSRILRSYLDALCVLKSQDTGIVDIRSPLADYLRWGFEQAERMDPLRPNPRSVLDEDVDTSDLELDQSSNPRKPR